MQIVAQDKQAADMGLEYAKNAAFFGGRRQLAFAWSPHFEAYLRTSGESNRHR